MPFCLVPSPEFSQAPWYSHPTTCVGLGYGSLSYLKQKLFLEAMASTTSSSKRRLVISLGLETPDLPKISAYHINLDNQRQSWPSLLRPLHRSNQKYRNINLFPIDYAFQPRLRNRLTLRRLTLRRNPWSFGGGCFLHPLSLLMSAFALLIPPASFSTHLHRLTERSSTASLT